MRPSLGYRSEQAGYTLIELLIVMGILAILSAVVLVTLIKPQNNASLVSSVSTLESDLRNQQLRAMVGDSYAGGTTNNYGVHIGPSHYTLFKGTTFSGSTDNFDVSLPAVISLSTTFPSSEVVFTKGSGDTSANATYTITLQAAGKTAVLSINRHGVITES